MAVVLYAASSRGHAAVQERGIAADVLASPSRLSGEQIRNVLRAAQDALKGKYLTSHLVATVPLGFDTRREFWMYEDDGTVRFMRYSDVDPHTRKETISLTEFTRQPARLCSGERPVDGRLAIDYAHWNGQWQPPRGSIAQTQGLIPIEDLLAAPSSELEDVGSTIVDGMRLRGFAWKMDPARTPGPLAGTSSVFIDPRTLLMMRSRTSMTMGGKTTTLDTRWSYPPAKPVSRPAEVTVPTCI